MRGSKARARLPVVCTRPVQIYYRAQIYLPSRSSRSSGSDKWGGLRNFGGYGSGRFQIRMVGDESGTNIPAVTFVTFVRLRQVGEAADLFWRLRIQRSVLGFGSTRVQNSAASPNFLNLTNVTNVTALPGARARGSRGAHHTRLEVAFQSEPSETSQAGPAGCAGRGRCS